MLNKNLQTLARRDFLKYSASALSFVSLGGCSNDSESKVQSYPIDSTVLTSRERQVTLSQSFSSTIPAKNLQNISEYDTKGYGVWSFDENIAPAPIRLDIMPTSYALPKENKPIKLLKFFAITDIHITDKESPSQLIYLQPANVLGDKYGMDIEDKMTSVYSPTMLYTTHVLDAVVQTINAIHKEDNIDFGLSLGDTCNSTLYNETRWYIDVLDGKVITPSSGIHAGAKDIDYQKPFKAAGLNRDIPWYQAIGNHDHFWMGSIPSDKLNLRASCVSEEVIAMPNSLARASNIYDTKPPLYYMGVLDGSTPNGDIINAGPMEDFSTAPKVIPDVNRRSLTKAEWAEEFFNTTSTPIGHGFNLVPEGKNPDFACYSFLPKSELPLKVIVLDDTQSEDDGDSSIHGRGFLDEERWAWLQAELKAGSDAEQLMVIACHVPIAVAPHAKSDGSGDTYMDWYENSRTPAATMENAVTLPNLIAELHNHPNLLMWTAGHRHVNAVKAFVDDSDASRGFWQVETSSLHDFPQQMRLFDISLNSDYTITISITNVDPAVKEGTPAWTARKYAVAAQQIVKQNLNPNFIGADPKYPGIKDPTINELNPNTAIYNADLLKELSPAMKAKLKVLFPSI